MPTAIFLKLVYVGKFISLRLSLLRPEERPASLLVDGHFSFNVYLPLVSSPSGRGIVPHDLEKMGSSFLDCLLTCLIASNSINLKSFKEKDTFNELHQSSSRIYNDTKSQTVATPYILRTIKLPKETKVISSTEEIKSNKTDLAHILKGLQPVPQETTILIQREELQTFIEKNKELYPISKKRLDKRYSQVIVGKSTLNGEITKPRLSLLRSKDSNSLFSKLIKKPLEGSIRRSSTRIEQRSITHHATQQRHARAHRHQSTDDSRELLHASYRSPLAVHRTSLAAGGGAGRELLEASRAESRDARRSGLVRRSLDLGRRDAGDLANRGNRLRPVEAVSKGEVKSGEQKRRLVKIVSMDGAALEALIRETADKPSFEMRRASMKKQLGTKYQYDTASEDKENRFAKETSKRDHHSEDYALVAKSIKGTNELIRGVQLLTQIRKAMAARKQSYRIY